jgi:hypothetical protein
MPQSLGERCARQCHRLASPPRRARFNEGDAGRRQPTRPSPPAPSRSRCSARGTDTFSGGAWRRGCSLGETSLCADARPGVGACQGFDRGESGCARRSTSAAMRTPRCWIRFQSSSDTTKPTGRPSIVSSGEKATKIPARPGSRPGMCVAGEPSDRPLEQEYVHRVREQHAPEVRPRVWSEGVERPRRRRTARAVPLTGRGGGASSLRTHGGDRRDDAAQLRP